MSLTSVWGRGPVQPRTGEGLVKYFFSLYISVIWFVIKNIDGLLILSRSNELEGEKVKLCLPGREEPQAHPASPPHSPSVVTYPHHPFARHFSHLLVVYIKSPSFTHFLSYKTLEHVYFVWRTKVQNAHSKSWPISKPRSPSKYGRRELLWSLAFPANAQLTRT